MNTQIIKYALALAGIATLTACSTGDSLTRVDKNKDGGVSFKEFDASMKDDIFKKFDANGDGKVSLKEWQKLSPQHPDSQFYKTDSNGDHYITRAEADAAFDKDGSLKKLFKQIDTDGNGSLSVAEIKAFKALVKKAPGKTELDKINNTTKSS